MTLSPTRPWRLLALLVLVVAAFGVAACGSDDDDGGDSAATTAAPADTTGSAGASATVEVPQEYRDRGKLVVATDPSYAPNEFVERGGTDIVGMDIDLANEIGRHLGLEIEVQRSIFDSIIPGLAARRFDLGISSFTETREREQTVDFVTYFVAGTSFYIRRGGATVNSIEDVCGRKVAVEKGTTQALDVQRQARECDVELQQYPDQNGANLAIQSGRAEIGMADSPVAAYIVRQSGGAFELSGEPYGTAPYGIAIPKESGLAEPILEAVRTMIEDGTYMRILEEWGVEQGAIDDPQINGAIS